MVKYKFEYDDERKILPKDVHCILSNHQEVLVLRLLREIIFCNYKKLNIHQPKKIKNN
jgi:hypothetical protein